MSMSALYRTNATSASTCFMFIMMIDAHHHHHNMISSSMFDLGNFFENDGSNAPIAILTSNKACDDTVSTLSMSSESTFSSSRNIHHRAKHKRKHKDKRKSTQRNAFTTNDIYDENRKVNVPPKIAFQIFELIEIQRRCRGIYMRHQEKCRQNALRANKSIYHSVTSEFESYCVDGELFV